MQNNNIFHEMTRFFNRIKESNRSYTRLAYQRDPDSLLDESLLGIWFLLIVATLFTMAFGAYYHYAIFQSAFGMGAVSIAASFTVFIILEVCKVYFGLHFFRGLVSKLWWKSSYRLLFLMGIGMIMGFAFRWSINISTKGVAQVNSILKTSRLYQEQTYYPPPAVKALDKQLGELDKAKAAGSKSTWRGRTTTEGLKVIQSNTDLQQQLIRQRTRLLDAILAHQDSMNAVKLAEIKATSTTLTNYGGKAEWATLLLLLLVVLFERINYDKQKIKEEIPPVRKEGLNGSHSELELMGKRVPLYPWGRV